MVVVVFFFDLGEEKRATRLRLKKKNYERRRAKPAIRAKPFLSLLSLSSLSLLFLVLSPEHVRVDLALRRELRQRRVEAGLVVVLRSDGKRDSLLLL